jgi:cell division protein FtsI (penicillin-binding protein 3)
MADPNAAAPELKRIRWLVRAALLWALIIFGRLAWLQTYWHDRLQLMADRQQEEDFALQPPRGAICTRDGVYLAVSVPAWSVILNPRKLKKADEPEAIRVLTHTLHLDQARLRADLMKARERHRAFVRIKSKAEPGEYQELKAWVDAQNNRTVSLKDNIEWLAFQQESWRAYPNNELAAPLVGSVDFAENGNSGIEQSLQKDLQGQPGWVRMLKDSQDHYVNALEMRAPTPGMKVTLTIDSQLQFYCDRELAKAVHDNEFESGSIIIMNPNNGEVYAMSAYPSFNPNLPPKNEADLKRRVHRAIGNAPDGGSVMKMMTVTGALEHTNLRASSLIDCGNGEFRYSSRDSIGDTHSYGVMPMEKVLWFSSNVGAIRIGIEVGKQKLYQILRDFGFGQKTGIDLPGESAGVLNPVEKWQPSSLYYVSIGHEMGVTTAQLAQAASVFASGGFRVKPKLILSKQAQDGAVEWEPETSRQRVIRASTAVDMRNMSEGVILFGTGRPAKIAGRTVGGKTGTAQLIDTKTGRYVKLYSSSFMGYAPLSAPKIVAVVTLNGGRKYGGVAAGPVFAKVAEAALNMLGEPADVPVAEPEAPKPQVAPAPLPNLAEAPAKAPEPVTPEQSVVTGAAVPDFNGLDKRAVARISAERGVPVEMMGAGLVRSQTPPAGSVLAMGAAVQVRFSR